MDLKFRSTSLTQDVLLFSTVALFFIYRLIIWILGRQIPKGLRLPPGPPGKLISGNAADMPTHHDWETYTQWAKKYGDLVHVKVYGKSMIFVNTAEIAHELFEKRSSIYSDRIDFPMVVDLMGWGFNAGFMKYGDKWRRHRKLLHSSFNQEATVAFHEVQIRLTRECLQKLNESPDEFVAHMRHLAGAVIMEITYGIKVLPKDDPYINLAERAMSAVAEAGNPGTYLVDSFPFLKYVPEWMPGAGFRRKAREWREPTIAMREVPFEKIKKDLAAGTANPSITASLLEDLSRQPNPSPEEEETIKNVTGVAYVGGSDTVIIAMVTFMLAMVLYPEAQRKAQEELDSVIGDRLPEFEDMKYLPYVNALCKETHRWHPVAPLAVAHCVMEDDVFGEYFIPGGSIVMGNAWAILHDEAVYGPRTEHFEPERFLRSGVATPTAQYGFGRRICPGRYLADNQLFICVASILKVFSLTAARDEKGKEIPVAANFKSGFLSHPEPFRCSIKPRSKSAQILLNNQTDV